MKPFVLVLCMVCSVVVLGARGPQSVEAMPGPVQCPWVVVGDHIEHRCFPPTPVTTPWSSLPPLSVEAKDFLVRYNINNAYNGSGADVGAVKRWNVFPITVYADSNFLPQDLLDATNLWQTATSGKVTFQIVDNPALAKIVFRNQWPPPFPVPPNICGVEGPDRLQNNVILTGFGYYGFGILPACGSGAGGYRIGLAHGLGHILGLGGHTASQADVMGSPGSTWAMSPLLLEIINWLYSVQSGTRPV